MIKKIITAGYMLMSVCILDAASGMLVCAPQKGILSVIEEKKDTTHVSEQSIQPISLASDNGAEQIKCYVLTLQATSPVDNSTNVNLAQNIILTFNYSVTAGTGNITIWKNDGSLFEQIAINDSRVTISSNQVTINPDNVFTKGTGYYVEIDSGIVNNKYGAAFDGISDNSTFNFSTVDIVINEVVTDPQQDWSSTSFTSAPGGTAGNDDEWIELYILSPGIDLSDWIIELLDGTDVTGDLTATGAFTTSYYAGAGTFNNTSFGDYYVLGDVTGSESMDNNITVRLYDPSGAVVDEITFSTEPSSGSSDIYNESAGRFANGSDSDSNTDWTQGRATPGTANTGPCVTLSASPSVIAEDEGIAVVSATLTASSALNTTVELLIAGIDASESDYTVSGETIVIPAGEVTGSISVAAVQDQTDEPDETISVEISSVTNGEEAGVQSQIITITDDDSEPFITLSASPREISEAGGVATLTASLSQISAKEVVVSLGINSSTTASDSDYTLSATTITIEPGSITGSVTITATDNSLTQGPRNIITDIESVTNATEQDIQQQTITILDDESSVLTVAPTTSASEDADNGLFTISTDIQFVSDVTITVSTGGTATPGTDYAVINTSVLFPAYSSNVTIPLEVIADDLVESDESVVLSLLYSDNPSVTISTAASSAEIIIADNDAAAITIKATKQAGEDDDDGLFTLTTDKLFDADVAVSFDISGDAIAGTDYTDPGNAIIFPAYSFSIDIPVDVIPDELVEAVETVTLTLTATDNSSVLTAAEATATITITDDDTAILGVNVIQNGSEDGSEVIFALTSDKPVSEDVGIYVSFGGTATQDVDYSGAASYVILPAYTQELLLHLIVTDDQELEGTETIILTLDSDNHPKVNITDYPGSTATATIIDNELIQLLITEPDVVKIKEYDGTVDAVIISPGTITGIIDNDDVTVTATASYDNPEPGEEKLITVKYTIYGSDAYKYLPPADYIFTDGIISEKITIDGITVSGSGCAGGTLDLTYNLLTGNPAAYQIIFNSDAVDAGFTNVPYTPFSGSPEDGLITIDIPENVVDGTYIAAVQFINESGFESDYYRFTFVINLSSDYLVTKFNDIILIDNSSHRFVAYQWFKNDIPVSGATDQYYYDPEGLSGTYYVQVVTVDDEIVITCPLSFEKALGIKASINAYPNPAGRGREITVQINGLEEYELQGSVLCMFNSLGIKIYSTELSETCERINVPETYGIYMIQLKTSAGRILSTKIIIAE